eukprot:jgi/Bigna1/137282/aug1.38_g11990
MFAKKMNMLLRKHATHICPFRTTTSGSGQAQEGDSKPTPGQQTVCTAMQASSSSTTPSTCLEGLKGVVKAQGRIISMFYHSPSFHAPMTTIWVASFGGALHAPVTTFFYLKLGASEIDIGTIDKIEWLLDRRSAYAAVCLSCLMCSSGCLIRGFAWSLQSLFVASVVLGLGAGSLWTTVLSYVSRGSPKEMRSAVVSGYLLQVTSLRIIGKSLYPAWNYLVRDGLGIEDELLRYRVHMGVCTVFCFFGFFKLIRAGRHSFEVPVAPVVTGDLEEDNTASEKKTTKLPKRRGGSDGNGGGGDDDDENAVELSLLSSGRRSDSEEERTVPEQQQQQQQSPQRSSSDASTSAERNKMVMGSFVLLAGALVIQSIAFTVGPFVREAKDCDECVYNSCGDGRGRMLDPILKSSATLCMPQVAQGRSFGVLATLTAIGYSARQMVGNIAGPHLYTASKDRGWLEELRIARYNPLIPKRLDKEN